MCIEWASHWSGIKSPSKQHNHIKERENARALVQSTMKDTQFLFLPRKKGIYTLRAHCCHFTGHFHTLPQNWLGQNLLLYTLRLSLDNCSFFLFHQTCWKSLHTQFKRKRSVSFVFTAIWLACLDAITVNQSWFVSTRVEGNLTLPSSNTHSLAWLVFFALYSYHGSINVGQVSSAIGFDWLWNKYVNTSPFPLAARISRVGAPEAICNVLGAPVPRLSLTPQIKVLSSWKLMCNYSSFSLL
jgi:hypothetical protein